MQENNIQTVIVILVMIQQQAYKRKANGKATQHLKDCYPIRNTFGYVGEYSKGQEPDFYLILFSFFFFFLFLFLFILLTVQRERN